MQLVGFVHHSSGARIAGVNNNWRVGMGGITVSMKLTAKQAGALYVKHCKLDGEVKKSKLLSDVLAEALEAIVSDYNQYRAVNGIDLTDDHSAKLDVKMSTAEAALDAYRGVVMNDQLTSATQYLLDRFNYETRMIEVSEQLALNPDALDEALVRFMNGDILALRLTIENAARAVCERSAQKLIKVHGDAWQEFYERDEFEW